MDIRMPILPSSPGDANDTEDPHITFEPHPPYTDPTVGVALPPKKTPPGKWRLVALGDSLTHGFQSGAIYKTNLSHPAITAFEMGWSSAFRYPTYPGTGGLPLDIETLVRDLEAHFGATIRWWEAPLAAIELYRRLEDIRAYWEFGIGSQPLNEKGLNHNLAIYGWDIRDALSRSIQKCQETRAQEKDPKVVPYVASANEIAALRVLATSGSVPRSTTPVGAAQSLAKDGRIETLVVALGANNCLRAVTQLKVNWSIDPDYRDLDKKADFTVWRPSHFISEFGELVAQLKLIGADHTVICTVPHVTIAPIARGVGGKMRTGSRYFQYYTRPWISDADFDPNVDPNITGEEARAVDSAIDEYNYAISLEVKGARRNGYDWYLCDFCGLLDSLASRRYIEDPAAQPTWWKPYQFPLPLANLVPVPNTHFFQSDSSGRTDGGIFALDGIHPTTIGYGIVANEIVKIMDLAGVKFYMPNGTSERTPPIGVDFDRVLHSDSLISSPPKSITADLGVISWINHAIDFFKKLL
jgi:hypothetical protein